MGERVIEVKLRNYSCPRHLVYIFKAQQQNICLLPVP